MAKEEIFKWGGRGKGDGFPEVVHLQMCLYLDNPGISGSRPLTDRSFTQQCSDNEWPLVSTTVHRALNHCRKSALDMEGEAHCLSPGRTSRSFRREGLFMHMYACYCCVHIFLGERGVYTYVWTSVDQRLTSGVFLPLISTFQILKQGL